MNAICTSSDVFSILYAQHLYLLMDAECNLVDLLIVFINIIGFGVSSLFVFCLIYKIMGRVDLLDSFVQTE